MSEHEFSFGKMIKHSDDMAEMVFNEGVRLSADIINEFHRWLISSLNSPCKLMVHHIHAEKMTLDAKMKLGELSERTHANVSHKAILNQNKIQDAATDILMESQRASGLVVEMFYDREKALKWLEE